MSISHRTRRRCSSLSTVAYGLKKSYSNIILKCNDVLFIQPWGRLAARIVCLGTVTTHESTERVNRRAELFHWPGKEVSDIRISSQRLQCFVHDIPTPWLSRSPPFPFRTLTQVSSSYRRCGAGGTLRFIRHAPGPPMGVVIYSERASEGDGILFCER